MVDANQPHTALCIDAALDIGGTTEPKQTRRLHPLKCKTITALLAGSMTTRARAMQMLNSLATVLL
jgi:hypothetical protein